MGAIVTICTIIIAVLSYKRYKLESKLYEEIKKFNN